MGNNYPEWPSVDGESSQQYCDSITLNKAKIIQVTKPILLEAYAMDDCTQLLIDRLIGCDEGDLYIPYRCNGKRIELTVAHPAQLLYLPGRYKIFSNCDCSNADITNVFLSRTPLDPEIARMYLDHQCCCSGTTDNIEC